MAGTIAISGKGGSGKTTLAAMMTRLLLERSDRAVLAIDADPNSCLGLMMGVEPECTIAELREEARVKPAGGGDKVRSLEYGIEAAITEAKSFDLLTMGRPEGPNCYCAVNNLLRRFMDKLRDRYGFVIIDNEAGMEHLSRRTTNNVDLLCITAEPTPIGEVTARRIFELARKLPISVDEVGIIWNRTDAGGELDGIETFGCVPYDGALVDISMRGGCIFDLDADSAALAAAREILERKSGKLAVKTG